MDEPSRRVRGDLWAVGRWQLQSTGALAGQGLTQGAYAKEKLASRRCKVCGQSGRGMHLNRRLHEFSKGRKKGEDMDELTKT